MKRSTATHRKIFRHICDNLDQELDSPACRQIKAHLKGCPDCLKYLDSLTATVDLYRRYPTPPLSEKVKRKLRLIVR
jgi:anti-sigma factor RsiW